MFDGSDFGELDMDVSPHTGLARRHWEAVADHLLDGSEAWQAGAPWLYSFPGPQSINGARSDRLEGFSRLALLAGLRSARTTPPATPRWMDRVLDGLEGAGRALASNSEDSWPDLAFGGQPLVEASAVAIALSAAHEHLWDPLSDRAKGGLITWLHRGLGHDLRWNNWAFFDATIATFLERLGLADGAEARRRLLRRIEPWYLGEGWYSDGAGRRVDYYNAWSFHFYMPLLDFLAPDRILEGHALRVHAFLRQYDRLFDSQGAPVYFGRSLTYRFAAVAPFFTAHLTPEVTANAGRDRLIASRTLRWFIEQNAIQDGRLGLGWRGELPAIAQPYSSGGSPLWAAKAFAGLLLPHDHPVWTHTEEASEEPQHDVTYLGAGALLAHRHPSGVVTLHPVDAAPRPVWAPRNGLPEPLYSKFAYSSITAPDTRDKTLESSVRVTCEGRPDGHFGPVSWSVKGDEWFATMAPVWEQVRTPSWLTFRAARAARFAYPLWSPRAWRGARIATLRIFHGEYEVRAFRLSNVPLGSQVVFGGYAGGVTTSTQRVEALTKNLTIEEVLLETRDNPFDRWVSVPELNMTVADQHDTAVFALAIDRASIAEAPPRITQRTDRGFDLAFDDGLRVQVSTRGPRLRVTSWDGA